MWDGYAARETRRLGESHETCSKMDSRLVSNPGHSDSRVYTFNHDCVLAITREWRQVKSSQFLLVASVLCFEKEKEVAEESGRREKKRKGKRKQSFMFVKVRNVNIISFFR